MTLDELLVGCDRFAVVSYVCEHTDGTAHRTTAIRCFTPDGDNPVGIAGNGRTLLCLARRHGLREDAALSDAPIIYREKDGH